VGQLDRIINMENISMTDPRTVDDEVVLKAEALATAFHVIAEGDAADGDDKTKSRKRGGKSK
jgi:Tfp pilus assembly protein PilO